ncbi:MAG TPA: nuclear transport factor 2 family protein [Lacunisphaera sp.]|nr:nuclear transport factor 2 family protein [Lacunisphaera sp.]
MKRSLLALTIALAVCSRSPAENSAPTPEAEAGLNQLRDGLTASFAKADIDGMLTYLAPDAVVTWQNGEISRGPEEVRAYYNKMMKGDKPVVKEVKAAPEVLGRHFYGDWAVSWGNLHDRFVLNDGRELALNSVFTITTAKRGDRWLVTGYHASVNAFENPVLSLAIRKVALWTGIAGAIAGTLLAFVGSRILGKKAA